MLLNQNYYHFTKKMCEHYERYNEREITLELTREVWDYILDILFQCSVIDQSTLKDLKFENENYYKIMEMMKNTIKLWKG